MLAQLPVAAVLRFAEYATGEVQRKPKTPEIREDAEQRSRERRAVEQRGIQDGAAADAEGPEHIDDTRVPMSALPHPPAGHHRGREAPKKRDTLPWTHEEPALEDAGAAFCEHRRTV
jgi:hypothetical protein